MHLSDFTTGLKVSILAVFISCIGFNYALYNIEFSNEETIDENQVKMGAWCGTMPKVPEGLSGSFELGKEIFAGYCAQCHAVHEKVVGPALKNVSQRWPNREALKNFIKYPQKTIDSGMHKYATALYGKYKQYMPNHDFLTDEELDAVLIYIKVNAGGEYPLEEGK